jgi:diadenosine tetraphosphate (Ap4A) HIT family hydrolase
LTSLGRNIWFLRVRNEKRPTKNEKKKNINHVYGWHTVCINSGKTAGQTIMHCHIHLIPRRENDVVDPIGGVCNLISGKGNYYNTMR